MASNSSSRPQVAGLSESGESSRSKRAMDKKIMQLTPEEEDVVEFENDGSEELRSRQKLCLVGSVVSRRPFNMMAMRDSLKRCWRLQYGVEIKRMQGVENRFLFQFQHEGDKDWVLEREPWSFDMLLIVLHPLKANELAGEVELKFTPFWIQLHNVPGNRREEAAMRKICDVFEDFIDIDRDTGMDGDGFLRARVLVDVTKPLCRGRFIRHDFDKHWIGFKYERLPLLCYCCGRLGHILKDCEKQAELVKDGITQYDISLRAPPFYKRDQKYVSASFKIEGKGKASPLKFWPGESVARDSKARKTLQVGSSPTDMLLDELNGVVNRVRTVSIAKDKLAPPTTMLVAGEKRVTLDKGRDSRNDNQTEVATNLVKEGEKGKTRDDSNVEGKKGEVACEREGSEDLSVLNLVDIEVESECSIQGIEPNTMKSRPFVFQMGSAGTSSQRKKFKRAAQSNKRRSTATPLVTGKRSSENQLAATETTEDKRSRTITGEAFPTNFALNSAPAGLDEQSRLAE